MPDIRSITILPTSAVSAAAPAQGSGGAITQGSVPGVATGTILSGFIVNRDADGNPVLRTPSGDIHFASQFFLNIGSEVSIRVENSPGGTLAHILTVNGQPPELAASQSAFAQEPAVIVDEHLSAAADPGAAEATATAAADTPAPPAETTVTLTGTVVSQAPASENTTTAPLPAGSQVTLKITGLTQAPATIPEEIVASEPQAPADSSTPVADAVSYSTYAKAAGTPAPVVTAAALPQTQTTGAVAQIPAANAVPQAAATSLTTNISAAPATATQTQSPAPATVTTSVVPTTVSAPPVNTALASSLTATVIGSTAANEANLQTPLGVIRLQPGVTLPTGSSVTFEVANIEPPAADAVSAGSATTLQPAPLTALAQQWTSLQQIFTLLTGRDPQASFNTIQQTMPWISAPAAASGQAALPPQNVATGLALFMTALRGGNFTAWIGESNVKWLQDQGHDALVSKAAAEFTSLARQFSDVQPQHWQPLFFPVAVNGEIQQARLFVKRDRKQNNNNNQPDKKGEDTRFVVEVDLTQLGEMQMDGFVRKHEQTTQFDLIIRSLTPLSAEIQQDIMQIYNNAGELTGYKGGISFQTVKEFPVNPMEDIVRRAGDVMV